ncbi:MAG: carbohydrate kinase family protein [bacterium]|nr:carbohydrate kinase family protein [bacterium]
MSRIDILSVGDIVTDAFIKLLPTEAEIKRSPHDHHPLLCMTYGSKIPFEEAIIINGVGNSPNAAVCFAELGLNSALVTNIGDDLVGKDTLRVLKHKKVSTEFVKIHNSKHSNYHYVLWYKDDRTILIKHESYKYHWPKIAAYQKPRWLYLSSIGESAENMHNDIIDYLKANPDVKLAFQPGTYQMKLGLKKLRKIYLKTEIFCCNKDEAQFITGSTATNIKKLIKLLHSLGPKIVVITDGPKGSFASDGTSIYKMPNYPDPAPPFERTGAGDAYSATFTAAIALGEDIQTALKWAPINAMSVVQKIGAQAGLLSRAQLANYLKQAPKNYKPVKI